MTLPKQKKAEIVEKFSNKPGSTGDTAAQIALLTERINGLTGHLSGNKKDYSSRNGLFKMVSQRKSLLSYLNKREPEQYKKLIQALNLRK